MSMLGNSAIVGSAAALAYRKFRGYNTQLLLMAGTSRAVFVRLMCRLECGPPRDARPSLRGAARLFGQRSAGGAWLGGSKSVGPHDGTPAESGGARICRRALPGNTQVALETVQEIDHYLIEALRLLHAG